MTEKYRSFTVCVCAVKLKREDAGRFQIEERAARGDPKTNTRVLSLERTIFHLCRIALCLLQALFAGCKHRFVLFANVCQCLSIILPTPWPFPCMP